MNGKGDRSRVSNWVLYRDNYEAIFGGGEVSETRPTYSYRDHEYYKDGKPIDELKELNDLADEISRLRGQLPSSMQDCTIVFQECVLGHGWLTATNWVRIECPTCQITTLRARLAAAEDWRADVENAMAGAMDEKCDVSERHCTCVPLLRAKVATAEAALATLCRTADGQMYGCGSKVYYQDPTGYIQGLDVGVLFRTDSSVPEIVYSPYPVYSSVDAARAGGGEGKS